VIEMTKLDRLKKEAKEACVSRGHVMYRFQNLTPDNAISTCKNCGDEVQVLSRPQANEIDIAGEAVAINCDGFLRNLLAL
jgi:hypothetical protein